ncbi:unnamed protein product [Caenorhabditis auriculariae]|uniref:Uncharacterized protein n=1 Tax=Caenorhabditis auriculariae TaxID=2777116 RepID=A0A8S1H0X8_9PELO|nr:unnamed protein product [Caenorhabditis auriculariae]
MSNPTEGNENRSGDGNAHDVSDFPITQREELLFGVQRFLRAFSLKLDELSALMLELDQKMVTTTCMRERSRLYTQREEVRLKWIDKAGYYQSVAKLLDCWMLLFSVIFFFLASFEALPVADNSTSRNVRSIEVVQNYDVAPYRPTYSGAKAHGFALPALPPPPAQLKKCNTDCMTIYDFSPMVWIGFILLIAAFLVACIIFVIVNIARTSESK